MAKAKSWAIEGQLNLFDYLAELPTIEQKKQAENVLSKPISFSDKKAQILSSAEEYLQKGERLTTLAKERFGEMVKLLSFSEIEEKLFNIKVNHYSVSDDLVPKIATTVIRPLLKALTTCDENDKALQAIKSLVDYDVEIKAAVLEGDLAYMDRCGAVQRLRRKSNKLLKFTLKEEGYKNLDVYGLQLNAHPRNYKNVLFKDWSQMGDIAEILAWLVCFTQFNRAIRNDELRPVIEEKLLGRKDIDPQYLVKEAVAKSTCTRTWSQDYKDIRSLFEDKKSLVGLPLQKRRQPSEKAIETVCSMLSISVDDVRRDVNMSYSSVNDRNRLELQERGIPFMYVLTNELDFTFAAIDPINWFRNTKTNLVYNSFLRPCTNEERYADENNPDYNPFPWPEPSLGYVYSGARGILLNAVCDVLELVFQNYKEKVETLNYLRETKSRAKVYQTKKNIPDKVVKMMQESVFNDYFGYVELDETCDLDKVSLLADQFIAFKETYLNKVDTKKVQIRFRKLGNYKAAGLYFPHLGCLCVDVRYPDSFVHEYGHCIDNITGTKGSNLSDEAEFYRCYRAYQSAFYSAVHKSETAKDQLKGKYKSSYYLQKTEAFARCFEMYVTRTLGVQNSICKPDSKIDFAYPYDDTLMEEINKYFSNLFAELHDGNEIAA